MAGRRGAWARVGPPDRPAAGKWAAAPPRGRALMNEKPRAQPPLPPSPPPPSRALPPDAAYLGHPAEQW